MTYAEALANDLRARLDVNPHVALPCVSTSFYIIGIPADSSHYADAQLHGTFHVKVDADPLQVVYRAKVWTPANSATFSCSELDAIVAHVKADSLVPLV